jgi:hypothetical protein
LHGAPTTRLIKRKCRAKLRPIVAKFSAMHNQSNDVISTGRFLHFHRRRRIAMDKSLAVWAKNLPMINVFGVGRVAFHNGRPPFLALAQSLLNALSEILQ